MRLEKDFDLPRDPEAYEASTHLIQRMKEQPMVEADVVTETIEDGEVERVDDNGVVLRNDWLMTTFEVVVAPKDGVVQTAYEVEG